jgi:hypothetical protein
MQKEQGYARAIEDDAGPLHEVIRRGLTRPLVLWGHPEIGQTSLLKAAARGAGLPYREIEPEQLESWEGYRDVSDSGHFRELSLEKFLARGERGDPEAFTLESGEVLHLRDLNLTTTKLVQAVLDQVLSERKLFGNPLPDDVRIVASCRPPDRHAAIELLGDRLRKRWEASDDPPSFKYPVFPLPPRVLKGTDHWSVLPSLPRFVEWGRKVPLAEEVLRFLEEEAERDLGAATAMLHAHLLRKPDLFPQIASPRAFADLGSLLLERRPYFSSRAVRDELRSAASAADFHRWFHAHAASWNGDQWIESDSSLTVRGEPVPGSVWLNHVCDEIRKGTAQVSLDDLVTYAAFERRSLAMWATQELGDDLGNEFVARIALTEDDTLRLRQG